MPICDHGVDIIEKDCSFLASHHTNRNLNPLQVMVDFAKVSMDMSHRCRDILPHILDDPYGCGRNQKIDFYGAGRVGAPFFVFVHGGLWSEGSRRFSCYFVEELVKRGCIVAVVGYDLVPEATLAEIVDQVTRAITHVSKRASYRSSDGMVICGHSAGAHLVAMAMAQLDVTVLGRINAAFLLSGIYDLTGEIFRDLGEDLSLTSETAALLSPLVHTDAISKRCRHMAIHIAYGDSESHFYRSQSDVFYNALHGSRSEGVRLVVTQTVCRGTDHFSLLIQFSRPHHHVPFPLTRLILDAVAGHLDDDNQLVSVDKRQAHLIRDRRFTT